MIIICYYVIIINDYYKIINYKLIILLKLIKNNSGALLIFSPVKYFVDKPLFKNIICNKNKSYISKFSLCT